MGSGGEFRILFRHREYLAIAMNESSSPVSSTGRRAGRFETALQRLFSRNARVVAIEDLNAMFRILTLGGDALREVQWTPGDKIQIQLGGWVQRTYTPLDWDPTQGLTRILAYLHGDGPGTHWAREARVGDDCTFFGPRRSIDLTQLQPPAILFGDETSFGLAAALNNTLTANHRVGMLFEISAPVESRPAIERLRLGEAHTITRAENDAHLAGIEDRLRALLDARQPMQFVLTGKSTSIQRIRRWLRQHGGASPRFQNKAYWAPGKKGLD
jgi:ferric-chelate reductase (NADPH)